MVELLFKLDRVVVRSSLFMAIMMLSVAALLVFFQVVTRFVFNDPSTWSEVISRSAMIWSVFLGAPIAFRTGSMIAVEVIEKIVPSRFHGLLMSLTTAMSLIFLGVLVWFGIIMTYRVRFQVLAGLEIPISWAYAALPIGALFSFIAVVARATDYFSNSHDTKADTLQETAP
ncbi:MAG: TRAP transporter small permease [Magnetovibrio sp.]|nr:TRAP transporter small permease [Magnetovibrio sp.]